MFQIHFDKKIFEFKENEFFMMSFWAQNDKIFKKLNSENFIETVTDVTSGDFARMFFPSEKSNF